MSFLGVEHLLRKRLGLDPAALGPTILPRTVENRMRKSGVASLESYLDLLTADPAEIQGLATELLVSETWFFRGGHALFQRLAQILITKAVERPFPVRVLSLPCSTGEEPFSLAIALSEQGVPPDHFQLEAVDLSPEHIEKARASCYSAFAFREPGRDIRLLYFRPTGNQWSPIPSVRRAVHFRTGNVTDPNLLAAEPPFDLIVCRNLFIYLTPEGRNRAIGTIERLLAPDGYLCLTPAEADRLPTGHFTPDGPIEFGLYKRAAGSGALDRWLPAKTSTPDGLQRPTHLPLPKTDDLPLALPVTGRALSIARARTLADAGQLAEAATECEELIRGQVDLADAHALLGVIHQAGGRVNQATEALRRALYLEPNHPEALTHMILLYETRGDVAQALTLRKRLQRISQEGAP
jgi:chemotaxis protein methyltransferase WspC